MSAESPAARIRRTLDPAGARVVGADSAGLADALAAAGVAPGEDLLVWLSADPPPGPSAGQRLLAAPPSLSDWLPAALAANWHPQPGYDARAFGAQALLMAATPATADAATAAYVALAATRAELADSLQRHDDARTHAHRVRAEFEDRLLEALAGLSVVRHERDVIVASTMWRATAPLRRLLNRLPRRRPAGLAAPEQAGPGPSAYEHWLADHGTPTDADRSAIRTHIARMPRRQTISVVMPAYQTPPDLLRAAIASVQAQSWPAWELCVADDASPDPAVSEILAELAAADPRIRWVRLAANGNISAATNAALALATGDFVALMDHDDLLPEHALYEVAAELDAHPDTDLIYTDEDQIDAEGRRTMPYLKPDFSIELMLAHNMVSHLGVYRRALVERLGGMRIGYEGSQDYDLAMRVIAASTPERIRHIPEVLYHWRQHATSFSKDRVQACVSAARRAIADYLAATGQGDATVVRPAPRIANWTRVQWMLPAIAPRVSVIVPTRDRPELLAACLDGVLGGTAYPDIEVIVVDNDSTQPETHALFARLAQDARVRVLPHPGAFNYAAMNNAAAAVATGPLLALLNNDIEVMQPGWLEEMASLALRPGIGAVGARLLYADGRVQHAGVVLGVGSFADGPGVAGHYALHDAGESLGYFGLSALMHEVAAVTAACMVVRRESYLAVGGFDAADLPVAFNDVDFCLKLRARGLRNLWTPYAELHHLESATRGDDLAPEHRARFDHECRTMRARWGRQLDRDPFYNPHFSRLDGLFRLQDRSLRIRPWA